jgi:hypothetical protein
MKLTFIRDALFAAEWKSLRFGEEDLQSLEQMLLANPRAGALMARTGGLRKARFAPPSRRAGKSGGTRVGYVYFFVADCIVLITIFPKNEKANLSAAEKKEVKNLIAMYRDLLSEE